MHTDCTGGVGGVKHIIVFDLTSEWMPTGQIQSYHLEICHSHAANNLRHLIGELKQSIQNILQYSRCTQYGC